MFYATDEIGISERVAIEVENPPEINLCTQNSFSLEPSSPRFDELYSMILAAAMGKKPVAFAIKGCATGGALRIIGVALYDSTDPVPGGL